MRLGSGLTREQRKRLLAILDRGTARGKRDYAMIAVLLDAACAELAMSRWNIFNKERNTRSSLTSSADEACANGSDIAGVANTAREIWNLMEPGYDRTDG